MKRLRAGRLEGGGPPPEASAEAHQTRVPDLDSPSLIAQGALQKMHTSTSTVLPNDQRSRAGEYAQMSASRY